MTDKQNPIDALIAELTDKANYYAESEVHSSELARGIYWCRDRLVAERAAMIEGIRGTFKQDDFNIGVIFPGDPKRREYQVRCMETCPCCGEILPACLASYPTEEEAQAHIDRLTVEETDDRQTD